MDIGVLLTSEHPLDAAMKAAATAHKRGTGRMGPLDANPVVQVTPGMRFAGIDAPGPEWSVGLSQEIAVGGQLGSRDRTLAAEQAVLAVEVDVQTLERRLGAAHLWFDSWRLRATIDLIGTEMSLLRQLAEVTGRAVAAGERTASDQLQVAARISELELRLLDAEGELVATASALAHALGRGGDAADTMPLPVAAGPLPEPPEAPLGELAALAERLPTTRVAELTARLEQARLRELEASRDLRLTFGITADSDAEANTALRFGISAPLPVFDRIDRDAPRQAADAAIADAAIAERRRFIGHRVRLLRHDLAHGREVLAVIEQSSLPHLDQAIALSERRLMRGEATAFELIDLRRRRIDILSSQHASQVDVARARLELWLLWQASNPTAPR